MLIGDRIRKIRIKKGYSQQFIAETIGRSQSKFNRIENGKSDILLNDLLEICKLFRINYIEMLQSNQLDEGQVDDKRGERSDLCRDVKSLKKQFLEIKEYLYLNQAEGKYL
jgi:transcriptional regulator with XRE-family HTH domain